jgi:CHASE3 domain sensor protein
VLASASDLERLVVDLETGERGFVITGDEGFLEPWTAAQSSLPAATSELEGLASGPVQRARAGRITAEVNSCLRDYSAPVVVAARRGDPSAGSLATARDGRRRVDALRTRLDQLCATESDLAIRQQDRVDAATRRAVIAAVAGLVGSVVPSCSSPGT